MHFYELPLLFALIGLALYTVLAGADFGAGFWQLAAGRGPRGERLRDHAHHAMAPVWEANHVWLIFVLTVVWTAYPEAFGSIASTLSVPLFIAAVGIILRGAAYALRSGATASREVRLIDTASGVSSRKRSDAATVTFGPWSPPMASTATITDIASAFAGQRAMRIRTRMPTRPSASARRVDRQRLCTEST